MPAIVRVVGSFVGSASARRRAQRPPSSTRPRSADRIESRTCCWRTPTKMKASESNGEIGRTNCDGMTANSGLVSADLAETVERMEPAAGARTCSSFFARGASTCAQPALTRLSAVPSHAKFGAEKLARISRELEQASEPRFSSSVRLGANLARGVPQSGPGRVIFPANQLTKMRFAGGVLQEVDHHGGT